MIRIAIVGVSGRMGTVLCKAAQHSNETTLAAAISRPNSLSIGKDVGELTGLGTKSAKAG